MIMRLEHLGLVIDLLTLTTLPQAIKSVGGIFIFLLIMGFGAVLMYFGTYHFTE